VLGDDEQPEQDPLRRHLPDRRDQPARTEQQEVGQDQGDKQGVNLEHAHLP